MSAPSAPTADAPEELVVTHAVVEPPVSNTRRTATGVVLIVIGLITILAWGVGAKSGDAAFALSEAGDKYTIPIVRVWATGTGIALGAVICLIGLWHCVRGFPRRRMSWVFAVVALLFVIAFLCWADSGTHGENPIDIVGVVAQTVVLAAPLILGAMAGVLCERTGVINVAIEGQMLVGAFAGALGASVASNLGVGVIFAIVAGGLLGALLAVFAIKYLVNQVVLGVVLNLLALGLTGFLYDALMAPHPETYNTGMHLSTHKVPGLADIPIIGKPLFDVNYIIYAMYVIIVVIDVALFRTRWGLRTRAVGEHPKAADTVGIKVLGTRYRNVILGGMVAGLAGAYLTLAGTGQFVKNPEGMTSGKGFIALAALIFGRWTPRGALGAALLFGFSIELQTLLSFLGTPVKIPSNLLLMLPYLVTLFAVAGLVGRVQAPAADGEPYIKG
ncbi:MAG TPA: ABC transporter permease [Jatrophihabitantaceae bacterium]|jgi:simple sugar transport system permease protein